MKENNATENNNWHRIIFRENEPRGLFREEADESLITSLL